MGAFLAIVLGAAVTIPAGVNPWKSASHPIPQSTLARKSDKGPQNAKEMYRELAAFPKDVSKFVWPTENPWVKGGRTVRAKDFGWTADDATACVQKALDSKAKTVILDFMKDGPWRVSSVRVPSDCTIALEKGVKVLGTKASQLANAKEPLFLLRGVKNVFITGKEDAYVGRYTKEEETGRNDNREYGGSGILIDCAENVAIRGLQFSNNGKDGCSIGGDRRPSTNISFENCFFHRNTRNGVSIVSANGVRFRNCSFTCTGWLQPKCGIDIEPWLPQCNASAEIYVIGCTFEENRGVDIQFSTSSLWPVTAYVKDCHFKSHIAAIGITTRVLYPEEQRDGPSDIIFENNIIECHPDRPPIRFDNGNSFHVTFRGGEVKAIAERKVPVSPIRFKLAREFRRERDDSPVPRPVPEGSVVFDGLKLTGFGRAEPISIEDTAHLCSVEALYGTVKVNGKNTDVAKYRYSLPDRNAAEKKDGAKWKRTKERKR